MFNNETAKATPTWSVLNFVLAGIRDLIAEQLVVSRPALQNAPTNDLLTAKVFVDSSADHSKNSGWYYSVLLLESNSDGKLIVVYKYFTIGFTGVREPEEITRAREYYAVSPNKEHIDKIIGDIVAYVKNGTLPA